MLVSDFIVDFLSKNGIEHAFGYPGGMVTYLMDSFARSEGIKAHVNYHEQGAKYKENSLRLEKIKLKSENPNYSDMDINEDTDFELWGVATWNLHKLRK